MIGVVDYGAGNLQSVANALDRLEAPHTICDDPRALAGVQRIVLPGVGHFGAAARALDRSGMLAALRRRAEQGTPLLGICLGMQLLLESSDEAPGVPGLGLLGGRSVRLATPRVPHMGWNKIAWSRPVLGAAREPEFVYFAHTFAAQVADEGHCLATADYAGVDVPAAVGRGTILGVQFHPEKSAERGLDLLQAFCRC